MKAVVKAVLLHPEARRSVRHRGQAARAGAAAVGAAARVQLPLRHRRLPHRQHRQPRHVARPDAAALADACSTSTGRASCRRARRRRRRASRCPRCRSRTRPRAAGYVNYMRDSDRQRRRCHNERQRRPNRRDLQPDFTAEIALADSRRRCVDRHRHQADVRHDAGRPEGRDPGRDRAGSRSRRSTRSSASQAQIDAAKRTRVNAALLPDAGRRPNSWSRSERETTKHDRSSTLRAACSCARPALSALAVPPARRCALNLAAIGSARRRRRATTGRWSASSCSAATMRSTWCCRPTPHRSPTTRRCATRRPTRSRCWRPGTAPNAGAAAGSPARLGGVLPIAPTNRAGAARSRCTRDGRAADDVQHRQAPGDRAEHRAAGDADDQGAVRPVGASEAGEPVLAQRPAEHLAVVQARRRDARLGRAPRRHAGASQNATPVFTAISRPARRCGWPGQTCASTRWQQRRDPHGRRRQRPHLQLGRRRRRDAAHRVARARQPRVRGRPGGGGAAARSMPNSRCAPR